MSTELRRDHCMRCGLSYITTNPFARCTCSVPLEPGILLVVVADHLGRLVRLHDDPGGCWGSGS